MRQANDPAAVDRACSSACTRAGITALGFALVAVALLEPLAASRVLGGLVEYVRLRTFLSTAVDGLERDQCFQALKKQTSTPPDFRTLTDLLSVYCGYVGETLTVLAERPPDAGPSLSDIQVIAEALLWLETDRLKRAQQGEQNPFRWTIARWLRDFDRSLRVVGDRQRALGKMPAQPSNRRSEKGNPMDLTLAEARVLAKIDLPDVISVERLAGEHRRVNLPAVALPFTLEPAALVTEAAILLSLIYFALYQREARLSPNFPAAGTIFAVVRRTWAAILVFFVLALFPPVSAIALARESDGYWALREPGPRAAIYGDDVCHRGTDDRSEQALNCDLVWHQIVAPDSEGNDFHGQCWRPLKAEVRTPPPSRRHHTG
jgi:hypothetical protein